MHPFFRSRSLLAGLLVFFAGPPAARAVDAMFAPTNLVAWCIVPFDTKKRGPEERAEMLQRLGIRRLAYDWRSEHIPTFDAEVAALRKRDIELTAWWFPAALNDEAKAVLDCLSRHKLSPQLWVTMGTEAEPDAAKLGAKLDGAVRTLTSICDAAAKLGSTVGLYNHLGWFGEPTNQVAIVQRLRAAGRTNIGIVYNFHHGHAHIDDFAAVLRLVRPYLLAVNLNGMVRDGDRVGKRIIPLGTGDEEVDMVRTLRSSGWSGPVGILGHTEEDAEVKLKKELDGLKIVLAQLDQPPKPKAPRPARAAAGLLPPAAAAVRQGRTGPALDARVTGLVLDGKPWFRQPPIRVTAKVRFGSKAQFNIIAASEAKSSPSHWELYTYAGTGELSMYVPGVTPSELRSGRDVCDGQWHTVVMHFAREAVRLSVDGAEVSRASIKRDTEGDGTAAQIAVGRLVEGGLGCDGWIEDLQVTEQGTGKGETVSLAVWRKSDGSEADLAVLPRPVAPAVGGSKSAARPVAKAAAGEPAVSGREASTQGEADWNDNRWQQTDVGPFLASTLMLPEGAVAKGLTVKVGDNDEGAVAYDTATGALRAAWTGGFLQFSPVRFGLIRAPQPAGKMAFTGLSDPEPRTDGTFRFTGLHRGDGRTVLEFTVDGTRVLETPGLERTPAGPVFRRTFWVDRHDQPLRLLAAGHLRGTNLSSHSFEHQKVDDKIGVGAGGKTTLTRTDVTEHRLLSDNREGDTVSAMAVTGTHVRHTANHVSEAGGWETVTLPASDQPQVFSVLLWRGNEAEFASFQQSVEKAAPAEDPSKLLRPGTARWPALTTRGQRAADTDILAVDTLTMPYDNPWKALLFASGVDFGPDGAAYVCTIHGDVWRVTGIDDTLRELKWKRFATGLFQPLGLRVRDGKVLVLGRDRITRLQDEDGDGEADFYESFTDSIATSAGGHDYVTCLEADAAGNLYYVDPKGIHRVSPDGRTNVTVATGWRNPNGMGVRPDGLLTVAPQQGEWTPSSQISEVRPGGYYGYGGPKVTAERALGYDAPLCWIPHAVDNSSGSQVWLPRGAWGPLGGQMLHLLWGRCGMMSVLRDTVGDVSQGAVAALPVKLLSGPNRATFNSRDGALYVAGSTGWQTSAVKDGALQRVRWTGRPAHLPVAWHAHANGITVTFSEPLKRDTAEDAGSYAVKRWNYRYAAQYGSKDWSVAQPGKEGRDDVPVRSAKLLADGRTVFLDLGDLAPVMQMELKWNLDAVDGKAMRSQLWLTLNTLDAAFAGGAR